MIVDFHTHIQDIKNYAVKKEEVIPFISGYSQNANEKAVELASKHGIPYYIGIAPQEVQRMNKGEIDKALGFVRENSVYAIGEIGLDFHWAKEEKDVVLQKYAFEKQLDIAEKLRLPVVIHSRKAEEQIVNMLIERSFSQKVAFHFYAGKVEVAKKISKHMDAYFSIIIFPSKDRKKVIKEIPLERLLVETDSPYVGKTPSEVFKSISYISRIKGLSEEKVAEQTSLNAYSFIKK